MNALERLQSNLSSVQANLATIAMDLTMEHSEDIINANIEQMRLGRMPDDSYIVPEYDTISDYWYHKRNPGGEPFGIYSQFDNPNRPELIPNLGNTGAFYESIFTYLSDNELWISATDPKWESPIGNHTSLYERYGDVLGMPTRYMDEELRPAIAEELKTKIKELLLS